ncbi:MAG TPA: ATP-dependent DNA helicase RecG [Candidatus Elarobacter sp.]|nr:ATP-dependent DNA helicase RecG [Candidatus Elarobacter sp.]
MGDRGSAVPRARAARGARRVARRCGSGAIAARQAQRLSGSSRAKHGLADLSGIGPETAARFAELGVETPDELLAYIPRAYRDWREPMPIASLREGEAIVVGRVLRVKDGRGRAPLTATVQDDTGAIQAKWFGRRYLSGRIAPGDRLFIAGRVTRAGLLPEINVASHRVLHDDERFRGEIVPVYAASKDLPTRAIRTAIGKNLEALIARRADALPPALVRRFGFVPLERAWRDVHAPHDLDAAARGRERIVFDEFFAIGLAAAVKRARRESEGGAHALSRPDGLWDAFTAELPFPPTGAQRRVIERIWGDMERTVPMNRLLQGDVGSGKTLVAAAAIVLAHRGGVQSALMAPTEILAAQHAAKLAPLLLPFGVTVEAVFGSQGARERRRAEARIASGEAALAVGTHALLTESVAFAQLGLVVIDEQHRFGVNQRKVLREKAGAPHTLAMTATPIPRTLAQTKYADMDVSIIDELPPGRTPVQTFVIRDSRKTEVEEFVRKNVELGRQAYVVAPAIEDDPETALTSALAEAERLKADAFRDLRVDVLHGKMAPREKDAVMGRFKRGETDVLVATTVVEVGVDVPNASVMVVLDAHRYGLAQLHQLRGRVGRGVAESFCILVAPDDAVEIERLHVLEETTDGFAIAEADLRMRKAGELAGTAQAGDAATIGNIVDDFALYMRAKEAADEIVAEDPNLERPEHRPLIALLDESASARAMLVTA